MSFPLDNALPEEIRAKWPFAPRYADVNGWRMHYIDEGRGIPSYCCMAIRRGDFSIAT